MHSAKSVGLSGRLADRALRGHSGGVRVDPELQSYVEIHFGWTDYIYHVGASRDCKLIADAGLLAGGTEPDVDPPKTTGQPRMVP